MRTFSGSLAKASVSWDGTTKLTTDNTDPTDEEENGPSEPVSLVSAWLWVGDPEAALVPGIMPVVSAVVF